MNLEKVMMQGSVRDLLQAPILFISGADDPKFSDPQVQLLRSYVDQGGFIFAVQNCNGSGFDDGIRSLASARAVTFTWTGLTASNGADASFPYAHRIRLYEGSSLRANFVSLRNLSEIGRLARAAQSERRGAPHR